MDTKKLLMLRSHFHFLNTSFLSEFLYSKMHRFGSFLWVFFGSFLVNIFGFLAKYIHRLKSDYGDYPGTDPKFDANLSPDYDQIAYKSITDSYSGVYGGKENDSHGDCVKTGDSVITQSGLSSCENKYQFLSSRDVSGFMEGPKIINFTAEEIFDYHPKIRDDDEGSNHSSEIYDHMLDQDHKAVTDASKQEKAEDPVESVCVEGNLEEQNEATLAKCEILEDKEIDVWDYFMENKNLSCENVLPEDQMLDFVLNPDSDSSCGFKPANFQVEMTDDNECSSYEHGDEILLPETSTASDQSNPEATERITDVDEVKSTNLSFSGDGEATLSFADEEEYIELEPHLHSSDDHHAEGLQEPETRKLEEQSSEKKCSDSSDSEDEDEDEDELDILQEHRHLVQQMKMEMRYARVKGLPTISEECETPKTEEDLKPLQIDDKVEYKDRVEEIQKFYRSYAEKMRKLDILNYQTLHAISFLQLKDSEVFMAGQKSSISLIKPLIPKFWPNKLRRIYADSTHKSMSEAHRDLELVYIGQICLSWEILHWQYAKAKELLEYDSEGSHSYSKVATEYQQFQVLIERFVEDEPFQGPRVQHFVRNRCILRALLQVPMITDDCLKDKKGRGEEEQDAISVAALAKIIKEAMQVFWQFLSTEKGETKLVAKADQGTQADISHPADARLLADIRTSLQQKERRLKDVLRSRNCIVKKFQKFQRVGENQALFISQVELKLVARVLNLSRVTTDQLMWCQKKLNHISFLGRKVHVEPSFCLFPC